MAPIKNIGGSVSPDRLREQERVRESSTKRAKQSGRTTESASTTTRSDTVDISPAAQRMAEASSDISRFQDMLQSLRTENTGQVAELQQRVEAGEFDKPEVLERVSEAILNLPHFVTSDEEAAPLPRLEEQINSIQARVKSGSYQTDQVLEQVATAIIRDIGGL